MTWAICHKSGTVLFTTSDERTMLNRKSHGWVIKMNTISNERLEKLSEYDCADRYEVMSMAAELLALRKEREKAEPVYYGPYTPVMMGAGAWVSIADELPPHLEGRKVWVSTRHPDPETVTRELMRAVVDAAWKHATESEEVPATTWADSIIDDVLSSAPPAPVVPKIDRKAICNKVHWLCARSPGATFYNAAEYALDEVIELLAPPAPVVPDDIPEWLKDKLITICDMVEDNDEYCQDTWAACRAAMIK